MVTFYTINAATGAPDVPVLYLDTLKVSTIEQTAEVAEAKGGKGNPSLIMWDYGKEINVTLEDALFSAKSMSIMFGNGTVDTTDISDLKKTVTFSGTAAPTEWVKPDGTKVPITGATYYDAKGAVVASTDLSDGETYFATFNVQTAATGTISITPSTFPGTYYITGDTYARSFATGIDEFFQFVIPKAKVLSENTITLEAEGDPSVFNMSVRVLRPKAGDMMKLIKYDVPVS